MRKGYPVFAILLAGALALQAAIAQAQPAATGQEAEEPRGSAQLTLDDLRTFTDVFNQVRRNYVEEIDDHTLLESAIRGMLLELDPHSAYLAHDDYENLEENSQGRYTGIGIDVELSDNRMTVRAVITDSPADQAGINPGDVITTIDGVAVKGRNLGQSMDDLLGEPGSFVELEILTPDGEQRQLRVERKSLQIPVLSFQLLDDDWGYFRITAFHRESGRDLGESLASIAADGIELRGVIVDLRNNPGGVLQGAVEMADGFLDDGVIVTTRGRNSAMQMEFNAQPGQWLPGVPVMILVDRGSASASEVFSGALQDQGRAVIVGERTFGKGSVQSVLPLRNGGGIKLTTARYYTPLGRSIQAEGIEPDVPYDFAQTAQPGDHRRREADLARHLDREAEAAGPADTEPTSALEDFPLEEALNALESAGILQAPENAPEKATEQDVEPGAEPEQSGADSKEVGS